MLASYRALVIAAVTAAAGTALLGWQEPANPPEKSNQLLIPSQTVIPPPPPDPNDFRVQSEVELVLLDISVKDKEGGFVSNLKKENFQVFDNKAEQPIRVFAAQDAPVTVGLVVDNSGSVRPKKPEIVTAALTFVTQSNPQDEVFIVNFNDNVALGLPEDKPFSDDRNLLRQALLMNPAQGRTALYDALKLALQQLDKGRLSKKTLVLVSDGGDNASDTTRDEIMHLAERSLATIYTIGIFDADDKDKNPGFLKALARMTGGEAFIPENTNHLVGICEKIAHDIRNRYTVGFVPTATAAETKAHSLRVLAKDGTRQLDVRTRTHYIPRGAAAIQPSTKLRSRSGGYPAMPRTTKRAAPATTPEKAPEKAPEPATTEPQPQPTTPLHAEPATTPAAPPAAEPPAPPTTEPAKP